MKKLFVALFALSAVSFSASAQDQRAHKGNKEMHRGGKAMQDLNLTEAQKSQLKANREQMKTRMEAIKSNTSLTEAQKKEQKQALMAEQKTKMESILTADQRAKMASSASTRKFDGNRGGKMSEEGRTQRFEQMKTNLALSNDQAAKIKALNEQSRNQVKAIRENTTLSEAAKKEQMKAVKENTNTQRKTILTAEQNKKWDDMKKSGKKGKVGKKDWKKA